MRSAGLTDAELQRAAELESELVSREREAIADNARRRARVSGLDVTVAGNANTPLSVRASRAVSRRNRVMRHARSVDALPWLPR